MRRVQLRRSEQKYVKKIKEQRVKKVTLIRQLHKKKEEERKVTVSL